ncbi:Uncharacterised protein [Mycobacteroides abscessus subsp. abscessus]|nr:Uncharacterised protein [Mycobacteroides abscessus subsp. abscessus]
MCNLANEEHVAHELGLSLCARHVVESLECFYRPLVVWSAARPAQCGDLVDEHAVHPFRAVLVHVLANVKERLGYVLALPKIEADGLIEV